MNTQRDLKEFCRKYLPGGVLCFLPKNNFWNKRWISKFHSRRNWNNLFWLVHGNNNKEFYWLYLFRKYVSVFFFFSLNSTHIFSNELKKIFSHFKSDSKLKVWIFLTGTCTVWYFYTWFQSCASTCLRFAITKFADK